MVKISFPGIGIEQFSVNMEAFSIGKISVRWYGIIITLGIILAFLYASWRAKQNGISADDMYDMTIYAVISGVIGARAYYVLTTLGEGRYENFWDVFAIWKGGLAIYGALIGGTLAVIIFCKIKKRNFWLVADCVIPGVELAQAIGRWGNFFNGEAYGATPKESSPLYFLRMGLQHEGWSKEVFYQPCFLYESVWNLLGFLLINLIYKKKKFNGQILFIYSAWYGFGRMLIEGLRTDSLYVGTFRISQVLGFVCFAVGTVCLIVGLVRARSARQSAGEYAPVYGKILKERERLASKKNAENELKSADVTVDSDENTPNTEPDTAGAEENTDTLTDENNTSVNDINENTDSNNPEDK